MYHSNSQPRYSQNVPYQQSNQNNKQDAPNSFQQQQFGPRFQTPQQFSPPGSFYQPQQHHDVTRLSYPGPLQSHSHYQSTNSNFDHSIPKPPFPSPIQNFETSLKRPHQSSIQNFQTAPNPQCPPPLVGPSFNQPSLPFGTVGQPFISPIQNYNQPPIQNLHQPPPIQNLHQPPPIQNLHQPPPIQNLNQPPVQNFNQPPPIPNYNQPPIQNYNNRPPIHDFNRPPPVTNYNQPITPSFKSQNGHQPLCFPHQSLSLEYGSPSNVPYQPQVHCSEPLKQPFKPPVDQNYQQQQSSFNLPRPEFNQRPPFRLPGQQGFPLHQQYPRYQRPQQGNNRFQFHPRQQHQNYRPRGPPSINNQSKSNNIPKKDKIQIACEMGDCDFVGHASAVKEHQNLHHRFGLHKKVLYSNNSDAVKNWLQERRKNWPTKDNIQVKLDIEEEKIKRGERIADGDFQRFNKNKKFNNSGSKKINTRKRPICNGEFLEPVEDPMNGNLKRFAGIGEIQKLNDTTIKPVALKLLEEYEESSDDEPPDETAIVKKSGSQEIDLAEPCEKLQSSSSDTRSVHIEHNKEVGTAVLAGNSCRIVNSEVKVESCLKVDNECEKTNTEHSQKRKRSAKKEIKPIKKPPPLRTPRTEIIERKSAFLEALMGDLMRSERNAITQCICYIRNNMHRFCKIQAA